MKISNDRTKARYSIPGRTLVAILFINHWTEAILSTDVE
jgi:hypothetical protein